MNTIEIISGVVLVLLCAAVIVLTVFTKSNGGGLNALSGKSGNAYSTQDMNTTLSKAIKNIVIVLALICFALNIISAHSI